MKIQPIKFQLSKETIKHIEKSTRCSIEEIRNSAMGDIQKLMVKRGAVKKPNKIKQWFTDKYKTVGENLGLLKKQYNFYTHID